MNTENPLYKNIVHLFKNRFVLFGIFCVVFVSSFYLYSGSFLPSTETKDLWFYSGIFMVLFSILFIEPYYTSPKNVITNAIPLLLVFLAIRNSFNNPVFWWATIVVLVSLLLMSIIALALDDKDKSPDHWKNKTATVLKDIVVILGQGKVLYSSVFIYFLLIYHSIQDFYTLVLFIFWFFVLSINPKNIHSNFSILTKKESSDQIGEIFGVQSKKIFLVKLFEDRKSIKKFDVVKFRYSMQDTKDFNITGIVFDTYLLNQEKWAKILQLGEVKKESGKLEKNIVYKITDSTEIDTTNKELKVDTLVGIVIENSTIGKIKFEYSKKNDDLQEGDLLELKIGDKRLFYQVIAGSTEKEKLEARNETGFIEGEAIQLGEWQNDKLSFQKFGWVPSINTPLFKADTSDITVSSFEYPQYKLGIIPGTSLPSVINLNEAVSHHMALLGVTGSGKSFLTQKIIEELLQDTKVICIDFTGEWKKKLDVSKYQIISKDDVETYLTGADKKVGVFELPALSNTTDVLKETQGFLEKVFNYAKKKYDENTPVKVALVLEEAHTITPETSFLGDMGDYSSNKALVNKMTQVALQGRKYGVGLLVIAQRTANVSKTVLTQCNTVICFQAFDETSFTFLGNYVGKDMVQALPNLKQYHAVVAGKAVRSNMPMIIDLKR
ncbi:MAG: DUF87 domain-containing protein [Patescibacteria group bacterium]|nr:DUF87 domain-containing protein [Patescibacteria group bacterium]